MLTTMRARDPHEPNRAVTPLALLFDLTFVVPVAAVVPELAHVLALIAAMAAGLVIVKIDPRTADKRE